MEWTRIKSPPLLLRDWPKKDTSTIKTGRACIVVRGMNTLSEARGFLLGLRYSPFPGHDLAFFKL
jgi:hypothetical protein